jgi:sugar/nucleoside kinase (ribokinase family)
MGSRGCYWADRDGNRFYRRLRPVEHMADSTGAGDAFMGGLLYAYIRRMTPEASADWALAAGVISVTSRERSVRE